MHVKLSAKWRPFWVGIDIFSRCYLGDGLMLPLKYGITLSSEALQLWMYTKSVTASIHFVLCQLNGRVSETCIKYTPSIMHTRCVVFFSSGLMPINVISTGLGFMNMPCIGYLGNHGWIYSQSYLLMTVYKHTDKFIQWNFIGHAESVEGVANRCTLKYLNMTAEI